MAVIAKVLLICFMLTPNFSQARTVIDEVGRRVLIPENPRRIITLAPNLTEMVYMLGREKLLIGATKFSNHPPEAKKIPRVGSYVRIDIEKIVSLSPDLCLASKDGNPRHSVDRLEELGIPVFAFNPQSLQEIMNSMTLLGDLLNAPKEATDLVADMRFRINKIKKNLQNKRSTPRVFFQIDDTPIISVGTDTFIHELITIAGGNNVAAGNLPYPRYNWEKIFAVQPDIVIITSMSGGKSREELLKNWQKWPQLDAVQTRNVHVVDANLFDRATPRLVDGLEVLAAILNADFFDAEVKSVEK